MYDLQCSSDWGTYYTLMNVGYVHIISWLLFGCYWTLHEVHISSKSTLHQKFLATGLVVILILAIPLQFCLLLLWLGLRSITATAIDYKKRKSPSIWRSLYHLMLPVSIGLPDFRSQRSYAPSWEYFKLIIFIYMCHPECYPLTTFNTTNTRTILMPHMMIK